MSLVLPLAVRLSTASGDRDVTLRLRDLSFRSTAPGGFASIQLSLDEPLTGQPTYLDYYGRCYVFDQRTGATVCEGRVEDPGRSAGRDGQVWDVVAVGPAAHARDISRPYLPIDRSMERWIPRTGHPKADRRADVDDADNPVLRFQAPTGTSWAQNQFGAMAYPHLRNAGLKLGAFNASGKCGANTANWRWQLVTRNASSGTIARTVDFQTAAIAPSQRVASVSFPAGDDLLECRMIQINATAQAPSDATWCVFGDVYVMQLLVDASGNELYEPSFDYPDGYLLSGDIIRDLLGRFLPQYDGPRASIAGGTYQIRQLAYPDGADAATVLDDLMALEPGYLWEALESNPANGRYRFRWRQWPTNVRYEADVSRDPYDGPGSADGLYNEALVRWRDQYGQPRTTRVTASVPQLTAAGLTRSPRPIDLGDEVGTADNALQVGQQFLAEHRYAPNAGRLTIARPILDLDTGQWVMPWEIKPGYLIRVRGVLPRIDALNNNARDGVTVFKIAAVDFRASDAAAQLELDTYAPSTARALADLLNRPQTRRR